MQPQISTVILIQTNFYNFLKKVDFGNGTLSLRRFNYRADSGRSAGSIFIRFLFVFQAAHESSAGSGNLRRVER